MTFHVFYTHVAPLGLGDMVIRHCYIHVAPAGAMGRVRCQTYGYVCSYGIRSMSNTRFY